MPGRGLSRVEKPRSCPFAADQVDPHRVLVHLQKKCWVCIVCIDLGSLSYTAKYHCNSHLKKLKPGREQGSEVKVDRAGAKPFPKHRILHSQVTSNQAIELPSPPLTAPLAHGLFSTTYEQLCFEEPSLMIVLQRSNGYLLYSCCCLQRVASLA